MPLAVLSVDLVAKLAKFEQDMGKAVRVSQKSAQDISSSMGLIKASIGGLAAGVTVGGFASFAKATIDSLDALNDLKDATGASISNISALEDVAARTGTNLDTVGTALVKFNAALKDAEPNSNIAKALEGIGLNVKELKALDPAEALRRTAVALAGFADDGNKARLTQELFGKSLREVAPLLKDVSELSELNGKVTEEAAQASEDLNKQLFIMRKNVQDAARSLVNEFSPALTEILKIYNNGGFSAAIDSIGNKLFDWEGSQQRKTIGRIKGELDELKTSYEGITLDMFGVKGDLAKQIEAKTADLAKAQAAYFKIAQGNAGRGKVNPTNVDGRASAPEIGKPGTKSKENDDFKKYLDNLDKQIEKSLELTTVEQLLLDIEEGRLSVTNSQQKTLRGKAEIIDGTKAQLEAAKLMDEASKSSAKYVQDLYKQQQAMEENNLALELQVQEIGLTKDQLNALTLQRLDDAIAIQEQGRAQLDLTNSSEIEIANIEKKIELLRKQRALTASGQVAQVAADTRSEQEKASKEFADTLNNDLKGAFGAAFRDSTGEPLKAFGDAIANVIYSRAATALADSLLSSAGGSGSGNILASLLSFDGGGYTGGGNRAGGLDGKGGFMAMLHPQETILDHTKGQSGGGTTVINNFTVGDVASVSMVQKAIAGSERRIAGAMGRSMSYGGALA